jgi:CheY-like chemotaxis protein
MNNSPPVDILVVEDNPKDALLVQEAFQRVQVPNKIHVVKNGTEALHFLRKQGIFTDAPRPALILMDLNMPEMDGRELLTILKNTPSLHRIPVVVFSDSSEQADIHTSYQRHANCYINKPLNLKKLVVVLDKLTTFWFLIAELPKN